MSHRVKVEGNFGSASCLKSVLTEKGVQFKEITEGGKTYLTFSEQRYNAYGNQLRICVSHPEDSSMDHDIGKTVAGWYRDSQAKYVEEQLLIAGHSIQSTQVDGDDIVFRVAVFA
tara:strand:- start:822 stop:1166 length:345 start_codon:yes stop_codon:yes gene_type:complete